MEGRIQNGMACSEFEALLSDALDGVLSGAALQRFDAHKQACAVCRLMFTESKAGMQWLEALPEVEPPARLVGSILAATSGVEPQRAADAAAESWTKKLRGWLTPALQPMMQPRFAMSFATAFFSVTLVLNVLGVRIGSVRAADLRPSAMITNIASFAGQAQGRVVKYYENLRFVYEIESRVRQLKNATEESPQPADDKKQQNHNNDTTGQPERPRHEEQWSVEFGQGVLASVAAPWSCDAVVKALDRR